MIPASSPCDPCCSGAPTNSFSSAGSGRRASTAYWFHVPVRRFGRGLALRPARRRRTARGPRNFTNGLICIAVTLFLKPGLMSPRPCLGGFGRQRVLEHVVVARAGAVAAVERVAHRLVGLVHRAGQADAEVLVDLPVDAELADERRPALAGRRDRAAQSRRRSSTPIAMTLLALEVRPRRRSRS